MFVIQVPYFNLDQIYDSGQVPRWIKIKDSKYVIPFKDKVVKIEQQRDRYDWNIYRLMLHCSEEDFFNVWFDYFDFKMDCKNINYKVKKLGGKLRVPTSRGCGIHIIHQDEFEAYVLAKLIEYVGHDKARSAMNHIAEVCGVQHVQSMKEIGKVTWYEWPTPEMILEKHDKLGKMGKINSWIKKLCEAIVNDGYAYNESESKLFRLFGMHDVSQFPEVFVKDVLQKNFGKDVNDFVDSYLSEINEKGIVYMYIVHYILCRQKEVGAFGSN